ncbi:hypothetical protein C0989_010573 [Termitomyces sp. Mn162]|nr:hypothetical protein C0989_010573 [Termitomyces sp. Mn162]
MVLPNAPPNSPNPRPPSGPTLGNSDTSPANPDGPLTNSNTFSAAINTFPEPLESSPTVPDPIIHLQLTILVCLTCPKVS